MSDPKALPVSWAISSLEEITSSAGGGTPSKSDSSYWTNGTIPWVSPKDMKVFNVTSSEDLLTAKALERLTLIPTESVLVVVRSGILSRTFPVSLNKMPVTINQDMRAFVPKSRVSARYIALQLIAKEQEILSNCSKHGTTVASIEGSALARFPLALSPPGEQTRIVEKLEELLSDLDAGVAELKAAQKKLGQYRQSLLKAAVEGALTTEWRAARAPLSPRGRGVGGEGAYLDTAAPDEAWLKQRAKELRREQTPFEYALWQQLRAKRFSGFKFRRQQLLGRYIVDFVCMEKRLIVEADGGQHNADSDGERDAWLQQQGFRVLRVWNNDIVHQLEAVLESIWQVLQQKPPLPNPSPARGEGLEIARIARSAVAAPAPLWREKAAALSALPSDKTHALALPRDAEEAALSPLSPCGRGAGGEGSSSGETGAQLLQRILAERRARWEAKQLAKFKEQGKAPPKDWQTKYPEPVQPDTTDLPALQDGWVWASVEQIASDERYSLSIGPFGSNLKVPDYRKTGVPLVFVRNIRSGHYGGTYTKYVTPEKAEDLSAHSVVAGDVLITKMGEPPGDADVYPDDQPPAIITADCIKIRCWDGLMSPHFLKSVINSHIGQRQIEPMTQGVAQKKVSLGRFSSLAVPVPPIDEQALIMNMVDAADKEAVALGLAIELALKQSTAQRKNILKAAFSGQLVPQDPNDEPASVLLARIRAERAVRDAVKKPRGRKAKETS